MYVKRGACSISFVVSGHKIDGSLIVSLHYAHQHGTRGLNIHLSADARVKLSVFTKSKNLWATYLRMYIDDISLSNLQPYGLHGPKEIVLNTQKG